MADNLKERCIAALLDLPPIRAGDTERDSASLCVDTVIELIGREAFEAGYKTSTDDERNDGTPYPRWGIDNGFRRFMTERG